jgi:hypothetical protein
MNRPPGARYNRRGEKVWEGYADEHRERRRSTVSIAYVISFDNCIAVDAPYSKEFVALVKDDDVGIPSSHRMWDKDTNIWIAWAPYKQRMSDIAHNTLNKHSLQLHAIRGVDVKPPPRGQVKGTHDKQLTWASAYHIWLNKLDEIKAEAEAKRQQEAFQRQEKERLRREQEERERREWYEQTRGEQQFDPNDFFGGGFRYQSGPRRPSDSRGIHTSSIHDTLYVTSNAPREVIEASYRALVKLKHPDRGGNSEEFIRIDQAYQTLRKGW